MTERSATQVREDPTQAGLDAGAFGFARSLGLPAQAHLRGACTHG